MMMRAMSYLSLLLLLISADGFCAEKPRWTQDVETQPTSGSEPVAKPATDGPLISDRQFQSTGAVPFWIWGPDDNQRYVLSHQFDAGAIKSARLMASSDNEGRIFINGKKVAESSEWERPMSVDVTRYLTKGNNTIEAEVENAGGVAAFVLKLVIQDPDGKLKAVTSDTSWQVAAKRGQAPSGKAARRGRLGDSPWRNVFAGSVAPGRVPNGVFETLPDYRVDKLFTVPKNELGSWVCIAFDNKGRLLASDQGNKGICRITVPPVGGNGKTVVEKLDFSACDFQPSGAQGMLWAFDSLYFSVNGGPGSGLYRARDRNDDDQFDECIRLKAFRGGGEHGPHSIRLSPDGKRIFLIAGNHTDPPFNAGDEAQNPNFRSQIPTNWSEDLLMPRMWDANGHARGKLAPGGWIASTDPDGKTWDIWSIGYRNPYDMAFNADGQLFAYDADMEWDVGAPWYRPTRVVHATRGSEFGWRSGTGKWPTHYADSLPPMVNIGPGSPVGVDFGYGLHFPERYQKALYICDWTFGTMYAIHIEPNQSTYRAEKQEFLSRTPLPLTDVAAGPDGALYFSIGGRGTQSELYRVVYTGSESTDRAEYRDPRFAAQRQHREELETINRDEFLRSAREDIASGDVFLRNSSRIAFYQSDVFLNGLTPENIGQMDFLQSRPAEVIAVAVAMARAPWAALLNKRGLPGSDLGKWKSETRSTVLRGLAGLDYSTLNHRDQLDYLRALSLAWLRLGAPDEKEAEQFLTRLDDQFPSGHEDLNRELCQMLVYLGSPTIVGKTVALLNKPARPTVTDDLAGLLARNRGYGNAIANMIANAPDQQQIWYAYCLRAARPAWDPEDRVSYFEWFKRSAKWAGGNSFRKFLQNIEQEAFLNANENERVLVEARGAREPFKKPELPKPQGPGHDWTAGEVLKLVGENLERGRNFENGKRAFAATRCILCHRFAGDGGATGPDLTQLAGRFNVAALTEAVMDPSKVISDQYLGSTVLTTSGKTISGRIVAESKTAVSILTDPEDSTKVVDVPRDDVEEIVPSRVSLMPADLLKSLNRDEVLDLFAYLLSRGDKNHPMYRK